MTAPISPRKLVRRARRNGLEFFNITATRRLNGIHRRINERADLDWQLRNACVDGMVTSVTSGMDCDCCKYHYRTTRPCGALVEEYRSIEASYEGADGPMSIRFERPGAEDFRESRDLALEAFEDGHSHVVYA